jgi:hypothetical protein
MKRTALFVLTVFAALAQEISHAWVRDDRRSCRLKQWADQVNANRIPDFGANLIY